MRRLLLLALLLAPAWLLAAPPQVDIPAEIIASSEYVTFQPATDAKAITYIGQSGVEPFPAMLLKDARSFVLPTRGLPAARYKFVAVASLNDEHTRRDFVVVVGNPPPPVVVVPPVNPTDPPVVPTPLAGMRVLVITESDTPLPKGVIDAMNSVSVMSYLRAKCLKGSTGYPEARIGLDDDLSLTNLSKPWQDLRASLPAQVPLNANGQPIPQLAIGDSSGSVVFKGPYPATEADAMALFTKFGGP
jgi:hypothetical protein